MSEVAQFANMGTPYFESDVAAAGLPVGQGQLYDYLSGGVADTGNDWFDKAALAGIGTIAGQGFIGALSGAGTAGAEFVGDLPLATDPVGSSIYNVAAPAAGGGADAISELIRIADANPGMTSAQLATELAKTNPEWVNAAAPLWEAVKGLGSSAVDVIKGAFSGNGGALSTLAKIGLPAALIAGLFEKNNNPLAEPLNRAANSAVNAADRFGALPAVGPQPSNERAIALANTNTGAWKPYIDEGAAFTRSAAGGLPSVDLKQYMNPYLKDVLDPAIKDVEEAAERRRVAMRHISNVSGNDASVPGSSTPTRYQVESGLLDRDTLRTISDLSGRTRAAAFDTASRNAGEDLGRKGSAGSAFGTLGKTVGALGDSDFAMLTNAGTLEALPQRNALDKAADTAKLYSSVIPGTSSALTSTNKPSLLTQATGAFGALNAANKLGML